MKCDGVFVVVCLDTSVWLIYFKRKLLQFYTLFTLYVVCPFICRYITSFLILVFCINNIEIIAKQL